MNVICHSSLFAYYTKSQDFKTRHLAWSQFVIKYVALLISLVPLCIPGTRLRAARLPERTERSLTRGLLYRSLAAGRNVMIASSPPKKQNSHPSVSGDPP